MNDFQDGQLTHDIDVLGEGIALLSIYELALLHICTSWNTLRGEIIDQRRYLEQFVGILPFP